MNSEIAILQKIDGIYDIHPIITPGLSAFELSVLFVLMILFLVVNIYLVWAYVFSKNASSRREIIKLQKRYTDNDINQHDAIYDLCKILRKGLEQKKLNTKTPSPKNIKDNNQQWEQFINELSELRYKYTPDTSANISHLFEESLFWFKR